MIKNNFPDSWSLSLKLGLHPIEESSYEQLIDLIAQEYDRENYPDDFMMPSVRNLSVFLGVKRNFVVQAYRHLVEKKEILYTQHRVGTFMFEPSISFHIAEVARRAQFSFNTRSAISAKSGQPQLMNILSLGNTYPVQLVDVLDLRDKNRAGNALAAAHTEHWKAKDVLGVLRAKKLINNKQQFCMIPDGKAVYKVLKTMTCPRDVLIISSRNDTALLEAAAQLRLNVDFSGADKQGMSAGKLEEICMQKKVKVVFVRLEPDFPVPHRMEEKRWTQLVRLSERFGFCLMVLDDDYEFCGKKNAGPGLSLSTGNVIYIAPYSKVYSIFHKTSMVAGPENFIAALKKQVKKIVVRWNHSPEKALMAGVSASELRNQLKRSNQSCKKAAFNLKMIFNNYLVDHAYLILPATGTFGFLKFKSPLTGLPMATFLRHSLYQEQENFSFDPKKPVDGFRISLFITDWASLENTMKMISEILNRKN
ncbi:GntR family transcriptional regulator [Pedobacter gandavensis]|uniref:GntR family transcriptional regulator n=1 Tax=Pedobacter gandavensis TaxID=2679963 RepID=UPI002479D3C0|nr:GntR family transcriptional regulator [Pedobacter gandavensis]WGQ07531.1 GntR family transcriptional regulator [Pedobacter gandavensis]